MSVKTIPVTVPEWVWGRLATIADNRHVSVAVVVEEAINTILEGAKEVRVPRVVHLEGNERLEVLRAELVAARKAGYRSPGNEVRVRSRARVRNVDRKEDTL